MTSHSTRPAVFLAVLSLTFAIPAHANDWPENEQTCARLAELLTVADVTKATGRKGGRISAATASRSDGCNVDIILPGSKTPSGKVSAISMTLRQHLSDVKAIESVQQGVQLAGGADNAKQIATDPRGRAYAFKFGFEYVSAAVDAVDIAVLVRDQTLDQRKVADTLGLIMFRNALASPAIAKINQDMHDVAGYMAVGPLLALAESCMASDQPQHQDSRRAFAATAFNAIKLKSVEAMSPYAQRWITTNRYPEMVSKQIDRMKTVPKEVLAGECARMAAELPKVEASMPPSLLKALSK